MTDHTLKACFKLTCVSHLRVRRQYAGAAGAGLVNLLPVRLPSATLPLLNADIIPVLRVMLTCLIQKCGRCFVTS